jgi:hypothetical protein
MGRIGLALSILSLLLLSASAFKDEETPYNIIMVIGGRCKQLVSRLIQGDAFEVITNYHRWEIGFAIVILLVCAWFITFDVSIWARSIEPNVVMFWEHADFSTAYGIFLYLLSMTFVAIMFGISLFPLALCSS